MIRSEGIVIGYLLFVIGYWVRVLGSGLFNLGFWIGDFRFVESLRSIRFNNGPRFKVLGSGLMESLSEA